MSSGSTTVDVGSKTGSDRQSPVVLDLGKHKRKLVKELRNGEGKLLDEVMDSIEELQRAGTISKSAQPVILIVREKPKKPMLPLPGFGR